jgi:enolase
MIGFAPPIQSNREGVELLMDAIEASGHLDKVRYFTKETM